MMTPILHITQRSHWETAVAAGQYTSHSLESEGFIHCSTPTQVIDVANARYRGQTDLVLLVIEPAQATAEIVYEDCYDKGQAFPHLYGPLNLNAVTAVLNFPPDPGGSFTLPPLPD